VLLTRYRYRIVDELLSQYASEGARDIVLAPALIDYDYWLQDYGSAEIRHQVAVNERLVRRHGGRILPIVAFDPWRQVLDVLYNKWAPRHGRAPRVTAMEWVRRAVMERGFVGVKVYPPMGFRPAGNTDLGGLSGQRPANRIGAWEVFPHELVPPDCEGEDFWTETGLKPDGDPFRLYEVIGRKVDDTMAELFQFCVAQHVPVMTHCRQSQEPTEGYALRAHPRYWRDVLDEKRWPTLRLNLGHFGDMFAMAAGPARDRASSWAWQVAALAGTRPNVYADVGYFEPIMIGDGAASADRFFAELAAMRAEMKTLDRKVLYGSDYHLTGLNENHRAYYRRFAEAFARGGGDAAQQDRFFFSNAVRYFGLEPGGPAWARLAAFHAANPAIHAERQRLFRDV
jgi:predicted TIM-barrel fold metal-dependent hydrolase